MRKPSQTLQLKESRSVLAPKQPLFGAQDFHRRLTGDKYSFCQNRRDGDVTNRASLVLASQSAVRARLLRAAGIAADILPARLDEAQLIEQLKAVGVVAPAAVATRLAEAKARTAAASGAKPGALIIGADQILVHEGAQLQKVDSRPEAKARLWSMRGRSHRLVTGCALVTDAATLWTRAEEVVVTLRAFSEAALEAYLDAAGDAALASVACYEIEGLGAQLIASIEGDYFSALGLPLLPLLAALRAEGALAT